MSLPIGFFAPLPLPMMIPFMGIQSAVMAEQFGTLFQYGKRRISAMSNEEFNKLTPEMLQERMTKQLEGMIPEMGEQIKAMRPMVELIIKEFANYILLATQAVQEISVSAGSTGGTNLSYLMEHIGHGHIPGVAGHPSSLGDTPTPTPTPTPDQQDDPNQFVDPNSYRSPFTASGKLNKPITKFILHEEHKKLTAMITARWNRWRANRNRSTRKSLQNAVDTQTLFLKIYGAQHIAFG